MIHVLQIYQLVTTQFLFMAAFKAPGSSKFILHTTKQGKLVRVQFCITLLEALNQYYFCWRRQEEKKTTWTLSRGKKEFKIKIITGLLHVIKTLPKQTTHSLKAFLSSMPDLQNKFRPVPSTHFFPVCKCDTIRPHMQASLSNTGRTFVRYVDVFPPKPLT